VVVAAEVAAPRWEEMAAARLVEKGRAMEALAGAVRAGRKHSRVPEESSTDRLETRALTSAELVTALHAAPAAEVIFPVAEAPTTAVVAVARATHPEC